MKIKYNGWAEGILMWNGEIEVSDHYMSNGTEDERDAAIRDLIDEALYDTVYPNLKAHNITFDNKSGGEVEWDEI